MAERSLDLFLTHAWRYHEDWTRATGLFDSLAGLNWRNFSVPWHDPAMDFRSERGGQFIRAWLESQIAPVDAVVLLAGVWQIGSARQWVELELDYAARHRKCVIGLPDIDASVDSFPSELRGRVAAVVPWDANQIVTTLSALLTAAASSST